MNGRIRSALTRVLGVAVCAALITLNYSAPMRYVRALPETLHVSTDSQASVLSENAANFLTVSGDAVAVSASGDERLSEASGTAVYRLFGVVPVKTIEIVRSDAVVLVPGGTTVGIMIRTQGVLVVGLGAVDTEAGALSPGSAAGIRQGDVILAANGETVKNADHLAAICRASDGTVTLTLERGQETFERNVTLVKDSAENVYRIGLWVRDSTAGVGTLSFYDVETGWFAALGHPVSDVDTQSLLTVREGRILESEIIGVEKGAEGSPGELIGVFSITDAALGEILVNSEFGIYGRMNLPYANEAFSEIEMAYSYEVHTGPAEMLATISEEGVESFDCEVVRVNAQSSAAGKGMIIDVTDERLLEETGGIVQGMSGCPIVQDGKLIGIVTHVFVNDPTRGYCIYAEWMREQILLATQGNTQ